MKVNQFLESLDFRRNNKWFFNGNDFLYELYKENLQELESTFELENDVSELDDKYLILIGRILTNGDKKTVYNDSKYLEIAKAKIAEFNV